MRRLNKHSLFLTLFAFLYLFLYSLNQESAPPNQRLLTPAPKSTGSIAKVTRVIDGDTIELDNKQKVRYIGIDTPEIHHPKKPVQCFGKEAAEKNKEIIEGKTVRLEKDVSETDKYGRLLRYVFIEKPSTPEGFFVNEYLVKAGYAQILTIPPDVKYADRFLKDQQEAREQNKGLWAKCGKGSF